MKLTIQEFGELSMDTLHISALGRNFDFCLLKKIIIQLWDIAGINRLVLHFIQPLPISSWSFFRSVVFHIGLPFLQK